MGDKRFFLTADVDDYARFMLCRNDRSAVTGSVSIVQYSASSTRSKDFAISFMLRRVSRTSQGKVIARRRHTYRFKGVYGCKVHVQCKEWTATRHCRSIDCRREPDDEEERDCGGGLLKECGGWQVEVHQIWSSLRRKEEQAKEEQAKEACLGSLA